MLQHLMRSLRLWAALLVAAAAMLQVGVGLAERLVNAPEAACTTAAEACADGLSGQGCVKPRQNAIEDACRLHCIQTDTPKADPAGAPTPSAFAHEGASRISGKAPVFPPTRLGATSPARSGAPLIYLFQRLLT